MRSWSLASKIAAVSLLFCCVCALAWICYPSAQAIKAYDELTHQVQGNVEEILQHSHQYRRGLRKDLLLVKPEGRLKVQVSSEDAEVAFNKELANKTVTELMAKTVGKMQEELYFIAADGKEVKQNSRGLYVLRHADEESAPLQCDASQLKPVQVIRQVDAKTSCYNYNNECFSAKEVLMTRYLTTGHDLHAEGKFCEKKLMEATANETSFDGHALDLCGDVSLENDVGFITAKKARLCKHPQEKKHQFDALTIQDNVYINLHHGGSLCCQHASFECDDLKAVFSDLKPQGQVKYVDNIRNKNGSTRKLSLTCKNMCVEFTRDLQKGAASLKNGIDKLTANDEVIFICDDTYQISGLNGHFQRILPDKAEGNDQRLQGLLSMNGSDMVPCVFSNNQGDVIYSQKISVDTFNNSIHFEKPRGCICSILPDSEQNAIKFHSESMIWDNELQRLTLYGDVFIDFPNYAKLTSEYSVALAFEKNHSNKVLRSIESLGKSNLMHIHRDECTASTIVCHGRIFVDHLQHKATLTLPKEQYAEQVHFFDSHGEIFADKVLLCYAYVDKGLLLSRINMEGSVCLRNRSLASTDYNNEWCQYALADKVEYNPSRQELLFASIDDHRVLFYDKINNLQMSAPKLKIMRTGMLHKEEVKGIGDVRFTFVESELEQLLKRFDLTADKS